MLLLEPPHVRASHEAVEARLYAFRGEEGIRAADMAAPARGERRPAVASPGEPRVDLPADRRCPWRGAHFAASATAVETIGAIARWHAVAGVSSSYLLLPDEAW